MKKRVLTLVLAVMLLAAMLSGCGQKTFTTNEARNGVVRVMTFYKAERVYNLDGSYAGTLREPWEYISSGSAFGVGAAGEETDVFVTNRHVIEETDFDYVTIDSEDYILMLERTRVVILLDDHAYTAADGLDSSRSVPCDVLYEADENHADLGVLRAAEPVSGRMALPLMDPSVVQEAGSTVYAMGYPSSTDKSTVNSSNTVTSYAGSVDRVTMTNGIVSLHTTYVDDNDTKVRVIQHTATINHGNSGGPLITADGVVVGVNTWGYGQNTSTGDQQAFAAIEIEYVQDVLDDLKISYDLYTPGKINMTLVIAVAAAVAVLIIAVVVILVVKSKAKANRIPVMEPVQPVRFDPPVPQPPVQNVSSAPDSRPRLQCVSGAFAGKRFSIDGSLRIGRDPGKNDLVFPAGTQGVSGVHCVLMVDGVTVWLKDLGSTYGTYLEGGRRLAANESVQLRIGEKFYLGSEREMFVIAPKGGI